jgi:hypothetical protein
VDQLEALVDPLRGMVEGVARNDYAESRALLSTLRVEGRAHVRDLADYLSATRIGRPSGFLPSTASYAGRASRIL